MDKICKDELLDKNGNQNIFSGKGCGRLCMGEGTDVDSDWCKSKKAEFCRKSDENMLTDDCYDFCSGHPDLCDDYLSGDRGMCSRLNIKNQEDLDKPVEGTLKKISDWCGCMMPRSFYQDYANNIDKKFNEVGYSILGQIDVSPECMYPMCKQGSIMTFNQDRRKREGMCTDCVQIMLQSLQGSFVNSNIASEQSASCGNVKQTFLLPGIYNATSLNKYIRVFDDKSYCVYPDEESRDADVHDHSEISNISEIPGDNRNKGSCMLKQGFYQVKSIDRFIKVHEDKSYCVFPKDAKFKDITYSVVDVIPDMNKLNSVPECEYSLDVGYSVEDISTYFKHMKPDNMSDEDFNIILIVSGVLIGVFVLVVIIVIFYFLNKRRKYRRGRI